MLRGLHKNPKQKIPLSVDLIIRNLKMKIKGQEEEIRRLRESLNSGDPLHLSVSFQHHFQTFHLHLVFISFYCECYVLFSILSSDTPTLFSSASGSSDYLLSYLSYLANSQQSRLRETQVRNLRKQRLRKNDLSRPSPTTRNGNRSPQTRKRTIKSSHRWYSL